MTLKKRHSQVGATLIIGLVFLLLMSMMGLSSLQNVNIQERISGNSIDNYRGFQAAEIALASAERMTSQQNFATDYSSYVRKADTGVMTDSELLDEGNWVCNDSSLKDGTVINEKKLCIQSANFTDSSGQINKQPRVKYEQVADDEFRISVWAQGLGRSSVILQSEYTRDN